MTEQQLKDLSDKQIQRIYDSIKDIISKEQFADIVEQVKQDEKRDEKGTLALEKKKRPVDCTAYAQYRQLSVDQIGEGSGVNSLFSRLLEVIAAMPESPTIHKVKHTLSHLLAHLSFDRASSYADDLNRSETEILDDLCLFISKISKTTFPTIAKSAGFSSMEDDPRFGEYSNTYRAIWAIIGEGTIALQLLGFNSSKNEARIDKAISAKATKLSGKPTPTEVHTPFCFIPSDFIPPAESDKSPLLDDTQIAGQQTFEELEQAFNAQTTPKLGQNFDYFPLNPFNSIFRGRGIARKDFNADYSPPYIEKGDISIKLLDDISKMRNDRLTVRADKLLSIIEREYIKQPNANFIVSVNFYEFCELCGLEINTYESKKSRRKEIMRDLDDIGLLQLKRGKITLQFVGSHRITTDKGRGNTFIECAIDPVYASVMQRGQFTQYPRELFGYDGTAYNIGKKIIEHYLMDRNRAKGTHDILSVGKIIEASGIKTNDDSKRHWRRCIKDSVESALDKLTGGEKPILFNWSYCKAKKAALSDDEAANIINGTYDEYCSYYITFSLSAIPDDAARIEANQQRKEKRLERKAAQETKAALKVIESHEKAKRKRKPKK